MTEDREGMYAEWEWNSLHKCWEHYVPHRIFPHEDGTFSVSSKEVWHSGKANSFEEAETKVLGISPEQAASDREAVEKLKGNTPQQSG